MVFAALFGGAAREAVLIVDEEDDRVECDWLEHVIYYPPWTRHVVDDWDGANVREVRVEYGPRVLGRFERAVAEYRASREGGGLWDQSEHDASRGKMSTSERAKIEREDAAEVEAFMRGKSDSVGMREYECYQHFWLEGMTLAGIARGMGTKVSTVRTWIRRIRERVAGVRRTKAKKA